MQPPLYRRALALLVWTALLATGALAKDDWLPVTAQDLAAKPIGSEAATILYLQQDTDDNSSTDSYYVRIKVFTEEGKKHADIEIPYLKDYSSVQSIKARTIRPDGSIVPFEGQVFDKLIVKSKWLKFRAKTFTLPAVQAGSIIEYRYRYQTPSGFVSSTNWMVQRELPVRKARFTMNPYRGEFGFAGFSVQMRQDPVRQKDGTYILEMQDIPAFEEETYMPPEEWMKMQVRFFYSRDDVTLPSDQFWKKKGKEWHESAEEFVKKDKAVEQEVARLVVPADTPEQKLRKLYARAQQIRHTTYDRDKTEKEAKREKLKDNNNVDDVLKRGYGSGWDINLLMLAMARAAGFDAQLAWLSTRDRHLFSEGMRDVNQLNSHVVIVRAGGKEYYLDPATLYCPFGMLTWEQTGVRGLRLNAQGGEFIVSPLPTAEESATIRKAKLRFDEEGVSGTLQVTFTGEEALRWRLDQRESDETGRREELEREVRGWLPATATITLKSAGPWEGYEEPLRAEFELSVPELGTRAGSRVLLPAGLLQIGEAHPFRHAERKHPVYFRYPFREVDEVTIELSPGMKSQGVPQPRNESIKGLGTYTRAVEQAGNTVKLRRQLDIDGIVFQQRHYGIVKGFYDSVKSSDEDTLVLAAERK